MIVRHGINSEEWKPGDSLRYVLWNKARLDPANNPDIVNKLAALAPHVTFVTTFGTEDVNVKVIGPQSSSNMKEYVTSAGCICLL